MTDILKNIYSSFLYFSRIKLPINIDVSEVNFSRAAIYLPLVGLAVGVISYLVSLALFEITESMNILTLFLIIFPVILTGGFHEDGFADFHDGFGGGYTKEQILKIMKDSFMGVYGVVSLIILFIAKFVFINEIPLDILAVVYLLAHSISRSVAVSLMYEMNYARLENSKAKLVVMKISFKELVVLMLFGSIPFLLEPSFIVILPVILILRTIFKKYLNSKIEGYTGDCLGALEQYTEITVLFISVIAINTGIINWI